MSRHFARAVAALALLVAVAAGVRLDAQKKDDKKAPEGGMLTAAQNAELVPVVALVDEVMKGVQPPGTYNVTLDPKAVGAPAAQSVPQPGDIPVTWKNDFLKGQNSLIYTPFTLSVEPGKLSSPSVVAYLRVVPRGLNAVPAPKPPVAEKDKKKNPKDAKREESPYPFEDAYFGDLRGAAGQPLKMSRAFAVPAGEYDVYIGLRERPAQGAPPAEGPVKMAVLKQELTIPNYHGDELQTSSVLIADKIEQLTAPLTPEAARERPYVLGEAEIVPAADLKFKKTEELSVVFQVYGVKLGDDKRPDLTVEYVFLQKDASGEKPFNKTPPQAFNAQTLPPNFDPAAGHQIVGGQAVPLATFPEGDFRLEIKITDNKAGKSITREVLFSVVPAS